MRCLLLILFFFGCSQSASLVDGGPGPDADGDDASGFDLVRSDRQADLAPQADGGADGPVEGSSAPCPEGMLSVPLTAKTKPFCLDRVEVTVARARPFIDGGFGTRVKPPANFSGKGSDPKDPGWVFTDNLLADPAALKVALRATWSTWTEGLVADFEKLPMTSLSWYEAYALCIWAGGHLPTKEEWDAAAGVGTGRSYPWGSEPPSGRASYGCHGKGGGAPTCAPPSMLPGEFDPVGSFPMGAGKYGHLDLGGSASEWVWTPQPMSSEIRYVMNGSAYSKEEALMNGQSGGYFPTTRNATFGFRCAR